MENDKHGKNKRIKAFFATAISEDENILTV